MERFLHLDANTYRTNSLRPVRSTVTTSLISFIIIVNSSLVSRTSILFCTSTDINQAQMCPMSTPPKASASTAEQPFKIFCDEHTPRHAGSSAFNTDFPDANDENNPNAATSKPVSKSTAYSESARPAGRVPFADVTQETVSRPRSLSAALAEIGKLEDALEASKTQNQEMKGEIVAYKDALNQAYEDGHLSEE
jgi:hypothetical protein